jgi:uroporphyrinogen-III decarboxylase
MTHKQRILAACHGRPPDRIPWVPRLDLWHNAQARAGTLPQQYQGMSLREITRALGIGYHAVVPDFLGESPDDTVDRCLGIYRLKEMPFETHLHGVEREVRVEGGSTHVTYHTPVGEISCRFSYTEEMRRAGATISWVDEHALQGPEGYRTLQHIFENVEIVANDSRYRAWQEWVGDDGVAVAFCSGPASPMQQIMRDLMPMTGFFLELHDRPGLLRSLCESMAPWFEAMLQAAVRSPAEIIFFGANYDDTITYPPFFEEHILPWLRRAADLAHANGKLLLTHTDGENAGLMHLYRRAGFDVADSLCPAPMTKLSLAEAMEQLPGVTIWGGIPSVAVVESAMGDADFDRMLEETLSFAGGRSHLILSIADTMPADGSFERVLEITERMRA